MGEHDADGVAADDALMEELRSGARSPAAYLALAKLAALRDDVKVNEADWAPIYRQLSDERLFDLPAEPLGREPATTMLPASPPTPHTRSFVGSDGETYTRVSAAELESFDHVDSTTIVDPGAPD